MKIKFFLVTNENILLGYIVRDHETKSNCIRQPSNYDPPPLFIISTLNPHQYFGTNLELFGTKFSEFEISPFSRNKILIIFLVLSKYTVKLNKHNIQYLKH
jgi:hypothetical protein